MAEITDLFGKASIDTDYAIATTVDATRTAGDAVLEAVDLSKFADETPVFFVTYKKTTDPLSGDVLVTDLVSWKALVNTGANTLTNMTLAPGYTDLGNDIGDFIECIPTSYWVNSMIDGIFGGFNPDGTLKASAIRAALGISDASLNGWDIVPASIGSITPYGNRSYGVTVTGYDATGILSPDMKVRCTRTVAAPNTAFSVDGVNDYYVKTSPNKMTWTDDFATGWWIYLTEYPSTAATIASRDNNTSGWLFIINNKGQLQLEGRNGGGANYSNIISHRAVPLKKWVHVAAQLDMSAFTATSTTSYIMIDGEPVYATVARGGTNPTALVQAGNFEVGSYNGGTNPFPGYIGDGGVFSAKVAQATMLSYMHQSFIGTETNLASAYKNGSATDLNTTTPNNLTATNGATTVASAPYGNKGVSTTLDYGIITSKPVFAAGNTTFTVQVPEGCTIPTSGGVASLDYSSVDVPYGFPRNKERWAVLAGFRVISTIATGTSYQPLAGMEFTLPTGDWIGGFKAAIGMDKGSPPDQSTTHALSRSTTALSNEDLMSWVYFSVTGVAGNLYMNVPTSISDVPESVSTATKFYAIAKGNTAVGNIYWYGANMPTVVKFIPACL